jgi:hypothetical protein
MKAVQPSRTQDPARSRRRKASSGVAAIVLGLVLVGALFTAGPASAYSRNFKLTNKSSAGLTLVTAKPVPTVTCINITLCANNNYPMDFEGRPGDGSALKAGGSDSWDLKYAFAFTGGVQYAANLWYKIAGTDDLVNYTIYTYPTSNESSCKVEGTHKYTCVAEGLKLELKNS